jgi:hypothetical protein
MIGRVSKIGRMNPALQKNGGALRAAVGMSLAE